VRIAIVGNFGLGYKATMSARAVPIAQELARRGHQVSLVLPRDSAHQPPANFPQDLLIRQLGPFISAEPGRVGALGLLRHAWLGLRLAGAALADRPDVLYAFKPKGYAGLALVLGWLLGRARVTRTVLALDTDDWEGTGGWADRDGGPAWQRRLIAEHERWCLRHAAVVTVASRELGRLSVPFRAAEVVYVPNAASPSSPGWTLGDPTALRRRLGLGDAPVVLAYTRFVEFAPARLVAVCAKIVESVPSAQIVVAGQGLAGEEKQFAQLATRAGLAGCLHLLGWTPLADLPNVFAAADVALYPLDDTLLNRAKCPMKLVDLLLAGVPVVADRVGQAEEYVKDQRTSLLTPSGDVALMASCAIALLQDPARRQTLGAAARADILANWTWSTQATAIETALHQAVAAQSAPSPRGRGTLRGCPG
jgi:glycosyltransferase involved in cell wall biosynthesis